MAGTPHGDAEAARLMPPPPPRAPKRRAETVLEEEDWLGAMEAIIERDFFPELGPLQDKVAWLEAVRSGDAEAMRAAQAAIARRRQGGGATPWTGGGGITPAPGAEDAAGALPVAPPPMSLDTFLAGHTSEDNASFREILDRTNKRRREKAAALLAPRSAAQKQGLLTGGAAAARPPALTDGYGTSGQPTDTHTGWKHTPVNLLMYDGATKESLPLSKREMAARVAGPPPAINHGATRLHRSGAPPGPGGETPSTSVDTASTALTDDAGSGGGSATAAAAAAPSRPGYDILATPAFEPGVDASPIMTWGEVEATPVRIEAEDVPRGGGPGAFRVQATPRREAAAHELAGKAGAAMRRRAGGTAGAGGATPARAVALAALGRTAGRGGGETPLSHAARRLAGKMRKGSGAGDRDAALRASYRGGGTPARSAGGWETPGVGGGATPSHSHGSTGGWTPRR